jgi:hypothetical protein
MAKDSQLVSGIELAAKSVVALINGRPRSPTEGEIIRAITSALHCTPAAQPVQPKSAALTLSPEAVAFIRAAQDYYHLCAQESDDARQLDELDALAERVSATAKTILRQPPRTVGDILARACIVAHYQGHDLLVFRC